MQRTARGPIDRELRLVTRKSTVDSELGAAFWPVISGSIILADFVINLIFWSRTGRTQCEDALLCSVPCTWSRNHLPKRRAGATIVLIASAPMHHPTRSPSYAQLTPRATRREAVSLASLVLLSSVPTLPVLALDGGVTAETARAQSEAIGVEAAGGLAPGTGRSLNALIKMRAETGVERTGAVESPLFKPGQCSALFPCPKGKASRPRGSP